MNYSYVTGVDSIDYLNDNNFKIKYLDGDYGISFTDDQINIFEEYIYNELKNGFWNEYLGREKVFIFKFNNGEIKKYTLNNENEKEILKLCCEFAEYEFESIDSMLRDNSFYQETYYKNS